jgi:hypothetical protein
MLTFRKFHPAWVRIVVISSTLHCDTRHLVAVHELATNAAKYGAALPIPEVDDWLPPTKFQNGAEADVFQQCGFSHSDVNIGRAR